MNQCIHRKGRVSTNQCILKQGYICLEYKVVLQFQVGQNNKIVEISVLSHLTSEYIVFFTFNSVVILLVFKVQGCENSTQLIQYTYPQRMRLVKTT